MWARLAYPVFALWAGVAVSVTPEDVATRFSDAKFETATTVVFEAKGAAAKDKALFLWVYQSRLGKILQSRTPNADEMGELRRLCKQMHKLASASKGGAFDGYGIELANGRGDTSRLPASRRVVFFFWDAGGCVTPSRGTIE